MNAWGATTGRAWRHPRQRVLHTLRVKGRQWFPNWTNTLIDVLRDLVQRAALLATIEITTDFRGWRGDIIGLRRAVKAHRSTCGR